MGRYLTSRSLSDNLSEAEAMRLGSHSNICIWNRYSPEATSSKDIINYNLHFREDLKSSSKYVIDEFPPSRASRLSSVF